MLALEELGFALGIVNPAHDLVRLRRGCDIRELGSGNAGATNAGRVLGRWGFVVVLILDGAKGAAPVCLARWVSEDPRLALATLPLVLYIRHASASQAVGALSLVGVVWIAHRDQLKSEFHRYWRRAQPSLDRPRPQP